MGSKFGRGMVQLTAVGVSAGAAAVAYLLAAPLWVLPLAAVGTWSTLQVLFVRPARVGAAAKARAQMPAPNCDAEIAEVARASQHILSLAERANDLVVRQHGRDIATALNRVVAHLYEDPDDLRASQKFLAVYVERAKYILARYVQYETLATPQAELVRGKVRDELLPLLVELCNAQLQRITYDDLRSLETDVDVLRKSINLEGL